MGSMTNAQRAQRDQVRDQVREGALVVGIDPGSQVLGWAALRWTAGRWSLVEGGTVGAPAGWPTELRLQRIARTLRELDSRHRPALVGIEQPFVNPRQRGGARTAIVVGSAYGVALGCFADAWPVPIAPARAKARGGLTGAATKEDVARRLWSVHGVEVDGLALDATDAIAVGIAAGVEVGL